MAEEAKGVITELLDRISGKESGFSMDLDNIGLEVAGRKISLNGKLSLGITTLTEK